MKIFKASFGFFMASSLLSLILLQAGCTTMRPIKSMENQLQSTPVIPQRSYVSRCIMENLIFESSFGGTLPPNIAVVGDLDGLLVLRSGQLKASHVEGLAGLGIRGIVTLSSVEPETEMLIRKNNIAHREFGFSSTTLTEKKIREAISVIASFPSPVLVHCHAGADRTGIVIASLRASLGETDRSKLVSEMKAHCHVPFKRYSHFPELLDHFLDR